MPEDKDKNQFWIFDTVVISNFLLAGAESILIERYSRRSVLTGQVYDEICAGFSSYPELQKIETLISDKIFILHSLSETEHKLYVEYIAFLGKGEASCISRAKTDLSVLVTDDRVARRQALQMSIPVTGTIGILKAAVISGILNVDDADVYHRKMVDYGFYSPVKNISDII